MAKSNPLQLKREAEAAEKAGRFDKAVELLEQIVQDDPRDWNVVNRIGDLYAKLNNPKLANGQYIRLARHWADVGLHLKSIALWKKVLKNDPSDFLAKERLGDLYARQGLTGDARQVYGELIDEHMKGMVSPQHIQEVLEYQKVRGGGLRTALVALGIVKDEALTKLLSRLYGVSCIAFEHFEIDPGIIKIIPAETARKYQVLPLSRSGATLTIAVADPTNVFAMADIKFMTGFNVEPVVASESALEEAIDRYYGSTRSYELPRDPAAGGGHGVVGGGNLREALEAPTLSVDDLAAIGGLSEIDLDSMADAETDVETVKAEEDEIDLGNLAKSADAAPVIKLTNVLLVDSLKRGASDIHIEPYEKEFRVRFRIDGILYNVMALPMKLRDPLTSRIKIMARLDVTKRRLPQDGRIRIKMRVEDKSRDLDLRVSVRPTVWGETIVMRLLDRPKLVLDLAELGLEAPSLERFRRAIGRGHGMVLVTGSRRSGRTSTLYSAVAALNGPHVHVTTAEERVHFTLPGVNHVQVNQSAGESHASVLRTFADMDADIILLDEIRDRETADVAVHLAQDGHLVLSSMPAEDAPGAVSRLMNWGIEPFLVGTAVNLIQAQRLVRRVCAKCKSDVTAEVPSKTLSDIGFRAEEIGSFPFMKGKGCATCIGTGYKGRVGLFEVLEVSDGIRGLIKTGAEAEAIRKRALDEGMISLRQSGLEKVRQGMTTIDEVLRETVL